MEYTPGGDIFESDAEVVVNPVNCQVHFLKPGWQKGLAGAFEKKFPGSQEPLRNACAKGQMKPGSVQLIGVNKATGARATRGEADLLVANIATKDRWTDHSQIEWVDRGLEKLAKAIEDRDIKSVALPMLGAGLGKLPWSEVRGSIEKHFKPLAEKGVRVMVMGEGPDRTRAVEEPKDRPETTADTPSMAWPADTKFYAGIGARDTPDWAMKKMTKVAEILAKKGYVMRSGAADGADSAFEAGVDKAGGTHKEIYLPWNGFIPKKGAAERFADGKTVFAENSVQHESIAKQYHPRWDKLGRGARSMMSRNASQMLGRDLKTPSKAVVCWTQGGEAVGGTGQSIRMANEVGIQVVNLGDSRLKSMSAASIARLTIDVMEGKKIGPAIMTERTRVKKEDAMAR
eukprot:GHVR01183243.1.p1 GENE.GHVR01183243.1~~GHVR01183243.1.p1  ORF type:complete len:401 (-),score=63.04 GHVR01183243.1:273-1475(-)